MKSHSIIQFGIAFVLAAAVVLVYREPMGIVMAILVLMMFALLKMLEKHDPHFFEMDDDEDDLGWD